MPGKQIFLFVLCGYAMSAHGQSPLGESYWQQIRSKADSIVIKHFGQTFFNDHIFFDPEYEINYIAFSTGFSCGWDERDTVTTIPELIHFEYLIGFNRDQASRTIEVAINPDGSLVPPSYDLPPTKDQIETAKQLQREVLFPLQEVYGFTQCDSECLFKYDLDEFIELAKKNGVRCRRKDAFRGLYWFPPDSASWAMGERLGRYELVLGRNTGRGETRLSNSVYKYNIVDAIVFDPFSGEVLRKEEYNQTYMIACGRSL